MMDVTCAKCGYVRQPEDTAPDYECPRCGVVYAKVRPAISPAPSATRQPHRSKGRRALLIAVLIGVVGLGAYQLNSYRLREEARAAAVAGAQKALVASFRQATAMAIVALEPAGQRSGEAAKAACLVAADKVQSTRYALMVEFPDNESGGPWAVSYLASLEQLLRSYGVYAAEADKVESIKKSGQAVLDEAKNDGRAIANIAAVQVVGPMVKEAEERVTRRDSAQNEYAKAVKPLIQALSDSSRPTWIPENALLQESFLVRRSRAAHVNVQVQ